MLNEKSDRAVGTTSEFEMVWKDHLVGQEAQEWDRLERRRWSNDVLYQKRRFCEDLLAVVGWTELPPIPRFVSFGFLVLESAGSGRLCVSHLCVSRPHRVARSWTIDESDFGRWQGRVLDIRLAFSGDPRVVE